MKRALIAAAALLALMVSPAMALTQDEAQQITKDAGCNADTQFVFNPWFPAWNAYYQGYGDGEGRIRLINMTDMSDDQQHFVLLHEIGHCLQGGGEWEADHYAIRKMAELGKDGSMIAADVWAELYREYGYKGDKDSPHGLLTERIVRGWLNRHVTRIES